MKTKINQILTIGSSLMVAALVLLAQQAAQASQSPAGCSANNLNVNIGVRANNITNGTTVTWFVTVANPANPTSCDVTLGSEGLFFICPGSDGNPNGTRTTLIPGGTTISPGYGPQEFEIPCLVNVNAGVRTAEGKVSAPGSVVHKNPLQDDPANVDKTISVNLWRPCLVVVAQCISALNPSGALVTVTYSGTLTNCGNILLNDVTVFNGQTAVFGPIVLAAGATTNFTATYTTTDLCGPYVTALNASGMAPLDTPVLVTSSSSSQCSIAYNPAITVTKVCPPNRVQPGEVLVISGVVSNAGNIALSNVSVVNSQPAANTPLLGPITLAVGQSVAYTGSYTVPLDSCGPYSDTVRAQGTPACGTQTVSATATASCPGTNSPSIRVTKACPTVPVAPGGTLTYTGSVTNTGNITLTDVVVVADKPNAGTRVFGPVTLAPGAGAAFSASYTVPLNSCGPYDTMVTATGKDKCFGVSVNDSASAACPGVSTPGIKVTKICPSTPAQPGGTVTFSGTVQNTGNVGLTAVAVTVAGPTNGVVFTIDSLAPGATAQFTGRYAAPADTCDVTDTLRATGTDICGNVAENSTTTTCPLATTAGLAITRACPEAATAPGQLLTFTGWITNTGNISLTNVTIVVDRPAANTQFYGPEVLTPGQAAGFFGSFIVPTNVGGCSITYNLSARGNNKCTGAAVSANTSGTCPVVTTPRIVVSKTCPPNPVAQGSTLVFSGSVFNARRCGPEGHCGSE